MGAILVPVQAMVATKIALQLGRPTLPIYGQHLQSADPHLVYLLSPPTTRLEAKLPTGGAQLFLELPAAGLALRAGRAPISQLLLNLVLLGSSCATLLHRYNLFSFSCYINRVV